jgi:hypothetical protein
MFGRRTSLRGPLPDADADALLVLVLVLDEDDEKKEIKSKNLRERKIPRGARRPLDTRWRNFTVGS